MREALTSVCRVGRRSWLFKKVALTHMTTAPALRLTALALATLCLAIPAAHAQPTLLLDTTAAEAAVALPEHAAPGSARVGRINPSAFMAGRVQVTLPDGRTVTAERRTEERGPRGELSWVGEFEDAPGSLLVVTIHRGAVTGFFHHGADTYELGVDATGRAVLFKVDEARLPDEAPPEPVVADDPDAAALEADFAEATAAGDVVVQDLLVVYTPRAVTKAGSVATLESKIINAVAAANSAYANSAINIKLNLVGMAQTNYAETGDMTLSVSRLRGTTDGYMDEVHSLRDKTAADLVSLISEDSNYCGYAYINASGSSGFASSAFSVVRQSCFSSQSFVHEIGHNQGNSHDRANGTAAVYPYSYGYRTCDNIADTNGQAFRTVMAYACSGTPRVNYFSNPDIYYNGAPMGVPAGSTNAADNARSMNNTATITAGFRAAPSTSAPTAPTSLTGTATASDRVSLSWTDKSSDESGFTLERAIGGGAFGTRATLSANTTSFVDSGLSSGGTTYHYRLRAYNSAGASAWTATFSVTTPAAAAVPESPTPAAVTVSGTTAVISWANVAGESSFKVVRETYNARKRTWSASTTNVAADTTVLTQSLKKGTYRYSVRAANASGTSAPAVAGCSGCGADGAFTLSGSGDKGGKGGGDTGKGK
jgi:hypothetical protein